MHRAHFLCPSYSGRFTYPFCLSSAEPASPLPSQDLRLLFRGLNLKLQIQPLLRQRQAACRALSANLQLGFEWHPKVRSSAYRAYRRWVPIRFVIHLFRYMFARRGERFHLFSCIFVFADFPNRPGQASHQWRNQSSATFLSLSVILSRLRKSKPSRTGLWA